MWIIEFCVLFFVWYVLGVIVMCIFIYVLFVINVILNVCFFLIFENFLKDFEILYIVCVYFFFIVR